MLFSVTDARTYLPVEAKRSKLTSCRADGLIFGFDSSHSERLVQYRKTVGVTLPPANSKCLLLGFLLAANRATILFIDQNISKYSHLGHHDNAALIYTKYLSVLGTRSAHQ